MKRVALTFCLIVMAGCTGNGTGSSGQSSGNATTGPQGLISDAVIYASVEAKFAAIDANSALHVAVVVKNGAVRMSGKVRSESTLDRFVAAAKSVAGVKHVQAQLQADPHMQSAGQLAKDFGLVAAVKASVAAQAGVNALSVDVVADRGVVVLTGTVHSEAIRATAVSAAKATNGVRRVVDQLHVAP